LQTTTLHEEESNNTELTQPASNNEKYDSIPEAENDESVPPPQEMPHYHPADPNEEEQVPEKLPEPEQEASIPVTVHHPEAQQEHNNKLDDNRTMQASSEYNPSYYVAPAIISHERIAAHQTVPATKNTRNNYEEPVKGPSSPSNPFGDSDDHDHDHQPHHQQPTSGMEKKASFNPFDDHHETVASAPPAGNQNTRNYPTSSAVASSSSMASYTYAPPPPPSRPPPPAVPNHPPPQPRRHNPVLDNTVDTRYHQPLHVGPPPPVKPSRPSPLLAAVQQQQQGQQLNNVPAASHRSAPVHAVVVDQHPVRLEKQHSEPVHHDTHLEGSAPAPPLATTGKQPSSLLMALKAEKAQMKSSSPTDSSSAPLPVASRVERMAPQLMKLVQYGIKQNIAANELETHQQNPKLAMKSVHQMITASLQVDHFASQITLFKPRIVTRISKYDHIFLLFFFVFLLF
jgi:hypothetical protein